MKNIKSKLVTLFSADTILVMLGYSFFKAVSYNSYVTNFTVTSGAYGYISHLPFMFSASVGIVASAIAIFFLARLRILTALKLNYMVPLALLAFCYLIGQPLTQIFGPLISLPVLGFIWGLTTTTMTIVYIELFVHESSSKVIILQLACASFFAAVIGALFVQLSQVFNIVVCILLALTCAPITRRCRGNVQKAQPHTQRSSFEQAGDRKPKPRAKVLSALQNASTMILAYFFFELVVGLINMFAYEGSSSFSISMNAPIQGMLICSILVVIFVFVTSKAPSPSAVYLFIFPLIITIFLILPFFGEVLGPPLSAVIYAAYVFTSMLTMFCYVDAVRFTKADAYQVAAIVCGGVRIMLMIGIGLGYVFSTMLEAETYMRMGLVAVSCVYFLGIVIVFWSYRNLRKRQSGDNDTNLDYLDNKGLAITKSYEELIADRVEELVEEFSLTNRERDVLIGLSKGNSAARIAEDLFISTSTVQGYIKTLYPKLGVNKKQQVLDLFKQTKH